MLGQSALITLLLGLLRIGSEVQSAPDTVQCGLFDEDNFLRLGSFAYPTEHQWVARVTFTKGFEGKIRENGCLGVLISKRTVLAPAHCFVQFNGMAEGLSVHLGVFNKSTPINEPSCDPDGFCVRPAQEIKLAEVAIHPEYDSLTLKNSLAVLTLQRDAKLNANVMPICMPPPHLVNQTLVAQTFVVAGLRTVRDLRLKLTVNTLSRSFCQSKVSSLVTSSTTVCGYQSKPERFYTGAPLVGMQVKGQATQNFYLVGLMLDWRWENSRIMSSFLAINNYLDFIYQNSDSLIVRS